ncbi:MAG: DUF3021 domain-containing protein [Lysinibacillus sp.]
MMKLVRNIMIGCLIGLSVSYTLLTIRALLVNNKVFYGEDLLEEFIIALILGAVIGAVTLIFESDQLSFRTLLVIHFFVVLTSVFAAGAYGDWYEFTTVSMLLMFGEVAIIYCIVWGIVLLLEKREIDSLNKLIRKRGL